MAMRRLDIGVSSYGNPARLHQTLALIEAQSLTDWRCFVVHNPGAGDDAPAREVLAGFAARNHRFVPIWMDLNEGYAGAVQKLFSLAETEYLAYCDNDIQIHSNGWDESLCLLLDRFHEVGMVFPNGGAYPIQRAAYQEIMWGVGFCWALSRLAMVDAGPFDTTLGHQEEADYCLRVRMAGYRCAAMPEVRVAHCATATSSLAAQERISRGVVNWVNKWNKYFNGKQYNYHSPNVTRWEDWPPNALYLEEYWGARLPGLNASPEVREIDGRAYDLIKVPRLSGFYRGRII
jgi:GT2 family glycosyltransferase